MRTRRLGADGPDVAAVGAGDVSLARAAARGVDASDVARALHEAIEAGIDVIDAAEDGERVVGEAVRTLRVRDRAIVVTRAPATRELQQRVEDSLRATRLEVLPLVMLAVRPAMREKSWWPELRGTCARLEREGKVLRWGAWLEEIEDGAEALAREFSTVSVVLNACERGGEPLASGALARRPLAGGALAGALGPGVKLARTDDRRELPLENIAVGVARLAALVKREPPAARSCDAAREQLEKTVRPAHVECATVAELALRWVIDRGAIALPRLHRREHVAEAVAAASAAPLTNALPDLDT